MASRTYIPTQLLRRVIRLSYGPDPVPTCVRPIPCLNRLLSTQKPRSVSTDNNKKPPDLRDAERSLAEPDAARVRNPHGEAGRSETSVGVAPKKFDEPNARGLRWRSSNPKAQHPAVLALDSKAIESHTTVAKQSDVGTAEDHNLQWPREHWQMQKDALKKKFGEQGWNPKKKLSPDTMEGIRALHEQFPQKYTTPVLAEQFKVSPEAIRRMLKSKWRPSPEKMEERRARWAKRHDRIWDVQSEMGLRPRRTKDRKPEGPERLDEIIPLIPNIGP